MPEATAQKKSELAPRWALWLLIGICGWCAILGGRGISKRLEERRLGIESRSWPSAEAVVMRCENGSLNTTRQWATVSYRYIVNGQAYFSEQINVATRKLSENVADFVQDYPVGIKKSAYYDPQNPRFAVLIPGLDKDNTFWLAAGGLLIALGLFGIIGSISGLVKHSHQSQRPQVALKPSKSNA